LRNTYFGLFFTSLAALALEILLTRIFSVATWYYFAFFAISVAMFGFTVGALYVYLYKDYFSDERLYERLTVFALLFAVAVDISLIIFLSIPFHPRPTGIGVLSTVIAFLAISSPFVCAGVVVCLCLTRFPKKVGLLYGADLVGAAIGAFMVFPVLNAMDAPTAIFLVGAVAAIGALFFARAAGGVRLYKRSVYTFAVLTIIMLFNFTSHPVRVEWVKSIFNVPERESWNTISRIAVYRFKWVTEPYSWGLSTTFKAKKPIGERMLDIDGVSETVMTLYDGTLESVEHVMYDVTSIAHYLRDDAKVYVIGVGGGRDVLAAKVFNQRSVVGAEINGRILEMVNGEYGDFTGHLDRWPGVRLINDEARSAITRMDEKFDIIQASCIATWSATSAGAFSLAENSLYTVEAWKVFLDHLTPTGILSFNRWYSPDYPAQLLRLTALAAHTLRQMGVEDPGRHIAVVRSEFVGRKVGPNEFVLI
jgi:spermidine synthase